jgi:hypothetical protein
MVIAVMSERASHRMRIESIDGEVVRLSGVTRYADWVAVPVSLRGVACEVMVRLRRPNTMALEGWIGRNGQ